MNIYIYNTVIPEEILKNPIQQAMYRSSFNIKQKTTDNKPYDYYIVPIMFRTSALMQDSEGFYLNKYIESLQYFENYPDKHVFFLQSDINNLYPLGLLLECGARIFCNSCDKRDHNIYPLPFFVYQFPSNAQKNIIDAQYDICFQGCSINHQTREKMVQKLKLISEKNIYLEENKKYFYSQHTSPDDIAIEKNRYFYNMLDSKFIMCPRGAGMNSARFFESIWAGRIPVLIADDARLPLEKIIPWNDLIVRVGEDEMNIEEKIQEFLNKHNIITVSEQLMKLSREYFQLNNIIKYTKLELL